MENAAEAIKMAGAVMLFVLAFSITMIMFNKAKTTTEAVLDNLTLNNFMPRVNPLSANETREVGIESIIPTLYRYFQSDENPTIIIQTKDHNVLQVFDTQIESIAHNNFNPGSTASQDIKNYYADLMNEYGVETKVPYLYGAPWVNQSSKSYYFERLNAYIYGAPSKHMTELNNTSTQSVYAAKNNTLLRYKGRTFIESYTEYNIDGQVEKDEYGEEVVTRPANKKVIIKYTLKDI